MNKNYWIIGLCLALAICIWFLLQPDRQHDTHDNDHANIVADHDTLKAHGATYEKVVDSIKRREDSLAKVNIQLRESQAVTRRQLDLKTTEIKALAREVQKHNKDTAQEQRIGELIEQVESLTFLLAQYQQNADSINVINDSLRATMATLCIEKDKRIAELQTGYDNLYKSYNELFSTNKDLMKSLKRQKLKTKIASVLGAVGAVLLLMK